MSFIDFNDFDSIEKYKEDLRQISKSMLEFMLKEKEESLSYLESKVEVIKQIIDEKNCD